MQRGWGRGAAGGLEAAAPAQRLGRKNRRGERSVVGNSFAFTAKAFEDHYGAPPPPKYPDVKWRADLNAFEYFVDDEDGALRRKWAYGGVFICPKGVRHVEQYLDNQANFSTLWANGGDTLMADAKTGMKALVAASYKATKLKTN